MKSFQTAAKVFGLRDEDSNFHIYALHGHLKSAFAL